MFYIQDASITEVKKFKSAFPQMANSNLEVYACIMTEDNNGKCYKPFIDVYHPIIFDVRLIPEKFGDYTMRSITTGKSPYEFTDAFNTTSGYKFRYISFIKRKLSKIRSGLKKSLMTEEEAYFALTGEKFI